MGSAIKHDEASAAGGAGQGALPPGEVCRMFAEISPRYDLLNHTLSLGLDFLWRRAAARELPARAPLQVVDLCCGTGDLAAAVARRLSGCHGGRRLPPCEGRTTATDYKQSVPHNERGLVLGLDFCEPMIRLARKKYGSPVISGKLYPSPPGRGWPAGPGEGRAGDPCGPAGETSPSPPPEGGTSPKGGGVSVNIEFLVADATHLPLADASFDAVTCGFGLRNVAPLDEALAEMLRILRPGGRIVILEFCRPEGRGWSAIFDFYFRHVLPMVGRIISGHASAYAYLPASVGRFVGARELARSLAALGATEVASRRLVGGVAALIVGRKGGPGS
jgi:demethylmenaquinone methyltransferase/2-methoxy-6-polyprenyl-1,4-benzoquinol methylase